MRSVEQIVAVYQELADWHDRTGQAQLRDRFLVLAADAALLGGLSDEAERLRVALLQRNPHHLLRPFTSFAEAMRSPDVQTYVAGQRRNYPPPNAIHLLEAIRAEQNEQLAPTRTAPPPATRPAMRPPEPPHVSTALPDTGRGEPDPSETMAGPLKVYRTRNEAEEAVPPPERAPRPLANPRPPGGRGQTVPPLASPLARTAGPAPAVLARPAPPPREAYPIVRPGTPQPPSVPTPGGPSHPEREAAPGAWFSGLLFMVVLLAGLALACYTLARPWINVPPL